MIYTKYTKRMIADSISSMIVDRIKKMEFRSSEIIYLSLESILDCEYGPSIDATVGLWVKVETEKYIDCYYTRISKVDITFLHVYPVRRFDVIIPMSIDDMALIEKHINQELCN